MSNVIPLVRVKGNGKVDLWDVGPQIEPKPPAAPIEPDKSKLRGADLAVAEVEYEDALAGYRDALRVYSAARTAYRAWHETKGGPVKVEFWGVDAREAMAIEPGRYLLDLPRGLKPGKAQIEADEIRAAEIEEYKRAAALDPQFGTGAQA